MANHYHKPTLYFPMVISKRIKHLNLMQSGKSHLLNLDFDHSNTFTMQAYPTSFLCLVSLKPKVRFVKRFLQICKCELQVLFLALWWPRKCPKFTIASVFPWVRNQTAFHLYVPYHINFSITLSVIWNEVIWQERELVKKYCEKVKSNFLNSYDVTVLVKEGRIYKVLKQ